MKRLVGLVLSAVLASASAPSAAEVGPRVSAVVAKGDLIPAFDTVLVDGKAQRIEFPKGTTTVLLFFMSGCPMCHRMIPEWNRAFERKSEKLRVIGVLMDQEPPGFFQTMSIAFPVVRSPGREFVQGLKVTRAPMVLRVAAGGAVEDVAVGPIDGIRVGELFRSPQ